MLSLVQLAGRSGARIWLFDYGVHRCAALASTDAACTTPLRREDLVFASALQAASLRRGLATSGALRQILLFGIFPSLRRTQPQEGIGQHGIR